MSRLTVGVIDYGVGNHASVWRSLHGIGVRCRVSRDPAVLDAVDLLLLPGVGAFPPAMAALDRHGLTAYLREQAERRRPIVGICLGMQLLADRSQENGSTPGLGLIPGQIVAIGRPRWHIGWNQVRLIRPDPLLAPCDGRSFYFNHSYTYAGPEQYQAGHAFTYPDPEQLPEGPGDAGRAFPVLIRRDRVIGLQFHPEKSQSAGREALRSVIEGLCNA